MFDILREEAVPGEQFPFDLQAEDELTGSDMAIYAGGVFLVDPVVATVLSEAISPKQLRTMMRGVDARRIPFTRVDFPGIR